LSPDDGLSVIAAALDARVKAASEGARPTLTNLRRML